MYLILGFLLCLVVFIAICRIRVLWLERKYTITEKDLKTFKEYNGIEDYEKETKHAIYAVSRSKTLFEKFDCLINLRTLFESLHVDYEKNEKVNPLLMEVLHHKFTFSYSAFITAYPEPIEESGLERFSLLNTKKYCPEYVWNHIVESTAYTNEELDDYFSSLELAPLERMCTDMMLYDRFKGTILFDEVMGCFVDEENGKSEILDNEVYSVTEEQLHQWLDEELAFLSYITEGLLNICIEYIRKESGIIRV
ncbi:TPA: DNA-binding protein [Providencia alcalifaciens]